MPKIPLSESSMRSFVARFIPAFCLVSTFLLAACGTAGSPPAATAATLPNKPNADQRFEEHAAKVLEEMWREFPEFAVRVGYYKYADQMTVPDQARRERSLAFYER